MPISDEKKKKLAFLGMALAVLGGLFLLVYDFLTPNAVVPVKLVRVTVPEGFNVRQIARRLEEAGLFPAEDFIKLAQQEEGFLFPDTYEFYGHALPRDVILKMKENFDRKLSPYLPEAEREGRTLREIIIMASLLEEEVHGEADRKTVAGILWKRLDEKAALRVDATLTYLTGKTSAELTDRDLKLDSPYNTYLYPGLPAGPISNPGLETIKAALYPAASPYWYYLSDQGGQIRYARDFEEHKQNRLKYLR